MPSETGDSRPACVQNNMGPKLLDPLPCPRCDSTNTKFCYYNNYNLSQPRHFCKACRRYWTHGGTLRNVPVGGGTRKNSKRSRSSSSTTSTSSSSTNTSASTLSTLTHESESLPVSITNPETALPVLKTENPDDLNLNENVNQTVLASENGNFISLLNSQQGAGLMGMVGYGPGFGYGLCEYGFGYGGGKGSWAYQGMGYFNGGAGTEECNTWQVSGGEGGGGGLVDGGGDCYSWPGLAISTTTGKGLK